MAVILKTITTRPSLDDRFWFEDDLNIDDLLIPTMDEINQFKTEKETGFVKLTYVETISWATIQSRSGELRADLVKLLDYADNGVSLATDTRMIWNAAPTIGPNGEPPFDPFSLTFSWLTEYSDLTSFNNNYFTSSGCEINGKNYIIDVIKPKLQAYNNTLTEELYVDGVLTDFDGGYKYL